MVWNHGKAHLSCMHLCVLIKTVALSLFSPEFAINRAPGPTPGKPSTLCVLAQCEMPGAGAGSKPTPGSFWGFSLPQLPVPSWPKLFSQVKGWDQSYTWQNKDAEAAHILLFIICSSSVCCLFICSFIKCGMLFQSWNAWFHLMDFLPVHFLGVALFVTDHDQTF